MNTIIDFLLIVGVVIFFIVGAIVMAQRQQSKSKDKD